MPSHSDELSVPVDAVIFDCDGTLTRIEGIDELARMNGVGRQVTELTAEAMGSTGLSPDLFEKRLNLVLPNAMQVAALSDIYFQNRTPDLLPVIQTLRGLGKAVYIVSAGLSPAVIGFGRLLSIDPAHIFAVDIYFDAAGNYRDFDRRSPLIYSDGKRAIVQQLSQRHPRMVYVGDGLNDYAVYDLVTRFVGYGGAFYRESIEQRCQYYLKAPSMAPLLPLCLTSEEMNRLEVGS
jgi:phosphoserine phosphatase